ncbi:MAG: helix-turn-helix transcriptional regulator [Pseudomonadota bacterium]|nr:helix-turn-helix transcriptional regulator [Pseudomonadota bacterium]
MHIENLGVALKSVRDEKKLSQKDVANALQVDQSRVSRIENGAEPSEEDVRRWLAVCDTPTAQAMLSYLDTAWPATIKPPSWDHPDLGILTLASETIAQIDNIATKVTPMLRGQLSLLRLALMDLAPQLVDLDECIAVVGQVASGKTTLQALAAGMVTSAAGTATLKDVALAVGSGRVTVCGVSIEPGIRLGVIVEPEPAENIKFYVDELCSETLPRATDAEEGEEMPAKDGTPEEIARALRNMAGLTRRGDKTGVRIVDLKTDPPTDLAAEFGDAMATEFLVRLNLPGRTVTEIWRDEASDVPPMVWLKETIRKINNGNHDGVSLPRLVRIILDRPVIESPYRIRLLDTRGVDRGVVARPDLAECLVDPRTSTVLCSTFGGAPDPYTTALLKFAEETGVSSLVSRASILVLAKNGEASGVIRDEDAEPVGSIEEGYAVKERQVQPVLQKIGMQEVRVGFFDASVDPVSRARAFLVDRVEARRDLTRQRIRKVVDAARDIIDDPKGAELREAQQGVSELLGDALSILRDAEYEHEQPHRRLGREIRNSYARTVWAMVRRRGDWVNLDAPFMVGAGVAADAKRRGKAATEQLGLVAGMLRKRYPPASNRVDEFESSVDDATSAFVAEVRMLALATFGPPLRADHALWAACANEWGKQGTGKRFIDRVADRIDAWFAAKAQAALHTNFDKRYEKAWRRKFIKPLVARASGEEPVEGK